jgi:hypothetical protein
VQLRSKLTAVASTLALAAGLAGLGVATAGPAAAYDDTRLCAYWPHSGDIYCAIEGPDVRSPVTMGYGGGGSSWNSPNAGYTGEISLTDSNGLPDGPWCWLYNSGEVKQYTCKGRPSEEWTVTKRSEKVGNKTWVSYTYQNLYAPAYCATAPSKFTGPILLEPCDSSDYNQNFFQCQEILGCVSSS